MPQRLLAPGLGLLLLVLLEYSGLGTVLANNGLDLLNVQTFYQQIVKGAIIIMAVMLESLKGRFNSRQ